MEMVVKVRWRRRGRRGRRRRPRPAAALQPLNHKYQHRVVHDHAMRHESVFEYPSRKNESLLIKRNAFLIVDFRLDIVDRIGRLYIQRHRLVLECLHKDLHGANEAQHKEQRPHKDLSELL